MAQAGPAEDRIGLIDALRGFALLGIFLANVLVFSGWEFLTDAGREALAGPTSVDWQHRFHKFFVDGKFYTIFSLLFGAGFALQLERLTRRGADGLRIYRRRVLILLGIGLVHSWAIWDGDILVLYALMGLVLPLFYRLPDRTLLLCSAALIFLAPVAGMFLFDALGWAPDLGLMATSERWAVNLGAVNPQDGVTWLRRADFIGWFSFVATGPIYSWGLRIMSWRIAKVLGIMVLGIWVGRRLAAGTLLSDRKLLWGVLFAGLVIGIPANLAYTFGNQWQRDWPSLIGTVPLALAYAAGFALAWPYASKWLGVFAAPGRMALTNYIAQSVISVSIFYGFGLGQIGYWRPIEIYAYVLAVYAAQVAFSHWWLSGHAQGPMEWLWRQWTYGNRRVTEAAPAV